MPHSTLTLEALSGVGKGLWSKVAQDRHWKPGVNCACVSRKSTASLALRGLEDSLGPWRVRRLKSLENYLESRIMSSDLHNPEASIPCLPRSKAIATLSICTALGPGVPPSNFEVSQIHLRRQSLPVPWAFPLKNRPRKLLISDPAHLSSPSVGELYTHRKNTCGNTA